MRGFLRDFGAFLRQGNIVNLAVAVLIGTALGAVVTALVTDVIMPPVGLLLGRVNFTNLFVVLREGKPRGPYPTLAKAEAAGAVTLNWGLLLAALVSFLIVALVAFLMVRTMLRLQPPAPPPPTMACPFCLSAIPKGARRCPACTSRLDDETAAPTAS